MLRPRSWHRRRCVPAPRSIARWNHFGKAPETQNGTRGLTPRPLLHLSQLRDALCDLGHDGLVDLDFLAGLHLFTNVLDVGVEILLASLRKHFIADHFERLFHLVRSDFLTILHRESESLACDRDRSSRFT